MALQWPAAYEPSSRDTLHSKSATGAVHRLGSAAVDGAAARPALFSGDKLAVFWLEEPVLVGWAP